MPSLVVVDCFLPGRAKDLSAPPRTMCTIAMLHASLNCARHQADRDNSQKVHVNSREVHLCFQLVPDVSDVATRCHPASRLGQKQVRSLKQYNQSGRATDMLQSPLVCRGTGQAHAIVQQVFKHYEHACPVFNDRNSWYFAGLDRNRGSPQCIRIRLLKKTLPTCFYLGQNDPKDVGIWRGNVLYECEI